MKTMIRSILFGAMLLFAGIASSAVVTNATIRGTLATSRGASIRDDALASWIYTFMPTNTPKLLVLTQCFGGDMANEFADKANTVVLSATSAGEEAMYGGYDAGAAAAMQPGEGRTAQDIHDAGVANRDKVETPRVAGGLNPTNFPMTSVSTSGVVRSRHVVWYAGQPDGLPGRDFDQDARLHGVFAGEENTTYRAVAASTTGGWDYDGTARGLREAILEAAVLIAISPNPAAEQFVLYASDHGDRHVTAAVATALPTGLPIEFSEFPTFSSDEMDPSVLFNATNTVPGFSIFIPFEPGGPFFTPGPDPFFPPLDWQLTITIPDQPSFWLHLTAPVELPLELDNGIVGDLSGEGIQLFFPVDKQFFVDSFFDVFITLEVTQTTGQTWPISSISQDSGEVPKGIAPSDGRMLRLDHDQFDTELVALSLHGHDGGLYPIQARTNLLSGEWETLDILQGVDTIPGAGGRLTYPILPSTEPIRFFRAAFPEPTIETIEPAWVPTVEEGAFIYLTGSGFYPGDTVLIGDLPAIRVEFDAHNLLRVFLPAGLPPGLYDVTVINGRDGTVLATLPDALQVSPPLARTLQAPPEWPPAAPAPMFAKGNGHVTPLKGPGIDERCDDRDNNCSGPPDSWKMLRKRPGGTKAIGIGDYTSGQPTGKRDHSSGHPTGRRMHSPLASNGGGSPNHSSDRLDDDSDGDGILDISLHSGEVEQQVVDLAVPGRALDFAWVRTYRSRTGVATAQGNRWSHSYDVRCVQSGGAIDIYDGTGRKDTFRLQADGTYTCPEFFREGTLDAATGVFRLTFADTGYWAFHPFGASPASGKLAQIVDRHGNVMMLNYDGSGRLTTIVDDLGRTHTVAYDPAGQIASVSDSSGRTVTYAYYSEGDPNGRPGDLRSVTSPVVTGTSTGNDFPSGKTVTYTYSTDPTPEASGLLLSMIDALGQTAARCVYDFDPTSPTFARCVSVQRGADAPTRITYLPQTPTPDNAFAALRCIVNDPEGNVSEHDFDSRNRCVALREYTGRAEPGQAVTATENRPIGKLRSTDPDFFESRWSWNNDSLCTVWQRPQANRIEWTYQADLDAATPPRQRGNLRVERRVSNGDVDGDGRSDFIERSFEHDPRFGSDPSPRFCNGKDNDCDGTGDGSFVTRVTNPRGFETRCVYDGNGNLVTLTRHGVVLDRTPPTLMRIDFGYNAYGQLAAITHAADGAGARRYDVYLYGEVPGVASFGHLTHRIVDVGDTGNNLTTSFEYDARGNVTRCVDPRGTPTDFEINALNQTVAKQTQGATFGERVRSQFFYDANNNLVQVDVENRAPDGTLDPTNPHWTTTFVYDDLNRMTQTAQEISSSGPSSIMINQFVYDANDHLILHRLPEAVSRADLDNVIAYVYDERGLLFRKERAPGTGISAVEIYDYDGNGNITRISQVDAGTSSETTCVYDGFDRPIETIDAMGNVATCLYDACGNRIYTRTDGELDDLPGGTLNRTLAESTFAYDPLNRRLSRVDSFFDVFTGIELGDGASQTDWSYAPNGQLLTRTDDNGNTTAYTYDSVGRLASVTDPKGNAVTCTYDANGNRIAVQTADLSDVSAGSQHFTETLSYDALDRCVSVTDNVGNTVSNAYDSCGNLVSTTDALGNESVFTVDGLGRVTRTVQYSGTQADGVVLTTSQSQYRNNRLVSTTDGNGNATTYAYDACDRCVAVSHPDGTVEVRGWNPRDSVAHDTDANGTTVMNIYDALDRLIHRNITVAAGVMDTTTFETLTYDGLGRLVSAANDASALSFVYDSLGNLIEHTQDGMVSTSTYDGTGNRLTLTCPDGRDVLTTYDALGLPTAVSTRATAGESPTTLATFAYDGSGRFAKIARNNSINTRFFWNGLEDTPNAPDDFGWRQVPRINHARAGGGHVIDQRNSGYDRNQNAVLRVMTAPWSSGGPLTEHRTAYDASHRLIRGTRSYSPAGDSVKSYVLDANGNRLQVTNNGLAEAYVMDNTIPPGDFQMNQYTVAPSGSFTYDANGNRISSVSATGERIYHYDYANRLVQVDERDGTGMPSTVVTYRYSPIAIDRRLDKSTPSLFVGDLDGTTTTYLHDYFKDDDCDGMDDDCDAPSAVNLLQTYVDGALQRTFVVPHVLEKSGALASISGGVIVFHHYGDEGSLLALTDNKGNVVERFDYDDFGAPLFFDAAGNPRPDATAPLTDELQLFQGMAWNAETGLYGGGGAPSPYMNKGELIDAMAKDLNFSACRYFDPETGRTLSRGDAQDNPGSISSLEWQDYNATRSNRGASPSRLMLGGALPGGAIISAAVSSAFPPPGGGGGGKAQDHNSSRSNKSNSLYDLGDLGGGGSGATHKVAKFKAGKALAETVKMVAPSGGRSRNPQTGKEIKVAAKKVAKFKAGKALAETVK